VTVVANALLVDLLDDTPSQLQGMLNIVLDHIVFDYLVDHRCLTSENILDCVVNLVALLQSLDWVVVVDWNHGWDTMGQW
jgi:hypothetical protein